MSEKCHSATSMVPRPHDSAIEATGQKHPQPPPAAASGDLAALQWLCRCQLGLSGSARMTLYASGAAAARMLYEPCKRNHGLPHDPYNAIVGPRPIGWITLMSAMDEINLAPYSFFNSVSSDPPMVMFISDSRKDTIDFVEEESSSAISQIGTCATESRIRPGRTRGA